MNKVITSDDFVIPRSMLSSRYRVESCQASSPFADTGGRVLSNMEDVTIGECCQEVEMLYYLSNLTHDPINIRQKEIEQSMMTTQILMDLVLESCRTGEEIFFP